MARRPIFEGRLAILALIIAAFAFARVTQQNAPRTPPPCAVITV
jgi:hypothetical protein